MSLSSLKWPVRLGDWVLFSGDPGGQLSPGLIVSLSPVTFPADGDGFKPIPFSQLEQAAGFFLCKTFLPLMNDLLALNTLLFLFLSTRLVWCFPSRWFVLRSLRSFRPDPGVGLALLFPSFRLTGLRPGPFNEVKQLSVIHPHAPADSVFLFPFFSPASCCVFPLCSRFSFSCLSLE